MMGTGNFTDDFKRDAVAHFAASSKMGLKQSCGGAAGPAL